MFQHLTYRVKLGPWLLRVLAGLFIGLPLFVMGRVAGWISDRCFAGYRKLDEALPAAWVLSPVKNQPIVEEVEWDT